MLHVEVKFNIIHLKNYSTLNLKTLTCVRKLCELLQLSE